jgi:hypothetical protein
MIDTIEPPEEDFQIRCPRLGHKVSFSYCAKENNGLPCHRVLDCWYPYFYVYDFFMRRLSKEEWEKSFFTESKQKVVSLFELIEKAKKTKEGKKKND